MRQDDAFLLSGAARAGGCHQPRPVLSSTLRLSLLAPVRMSWDGEWMASLGGWAYFDASVREAYPWVNNMAIGNLLYIYIHDRFSSKPRLIAGGYEHVRTTFLANSCLTCAWDERKWPGMVRGIHGWNIPVLNNTPATRSVLSHPGASKRGILGARH